MTDHDDTVDKSGSERDVIAQLVRAAGHRAAPPADVYSRVRAASHDSWQRRLRLRRQRRWAYALAASLAVTVVGVLTVAPPTVESPTAVATAAVVIGEVELLSQDSWHPLATGAEVPSGARLRAGAGGGAAFRLAKGATVRVADGTEWAFAASDRIELAAGTIYIDSGAEGSGGFEVATPLGVVRDIGTQFEVGAASATLSVRVREGLVELARDAAAEPVAARAGQRLIVTSGGEVARESIAPSDAAWSWAETLAEPLRVEGRSTYEVLRWVARETGRRLEFDDPLAELRARNAILSGRDQGLMPLAALEVAIAATDGLDYVLEDGVLMIRLR